uniref:Uncharacterized protein n=1 Tax=Strix occidentalis caurina TaxID=311401 RepID=A0A8D0FZC8_STROC
MALQEALSDKNPGPSCDLPSRTLQSPGTEAKSSPDEEGAEDEDYQPHDARGIPPGCQRLGGHRQASAVPHQQRGVTWRGWSHHPWVCLRVVWVRCWGMWCRGELCRVGLRVGLDDPKGLFQPE